MNVRQFWKSVRAPRRHSFLWRFFRAYFRPYVWWRRLQQLFRRLESVFVARVLASGAKVEMLTDQVSICRMSRAIAAALYTIAFEVWLIMAPWNEHHVGWMFDPTVLLWWGVMILLSIAGFMIVRGAYSRFCQILFSLLYVTSRPRGAGK